MAHSTKVRRGRAFATSNADLFAEAEKTPLPFRALDLCEAILGADPRHLPTLELKAKCLWRSGRFQETLEVLEAATELNPFDPGYFYLKGDCLENLSRYPEAVAAFERCRDSTDPRLLTEAERRIRDLEDRQEDMIACLLRSNEQFRADYRLDPLQCLAAHGFKFSKSGPKAKGIPELHSPSQWARPS